MHRAPIRSATESVKPPLRVRAALPHGVLFAAGFVTLLLNGCGVRAGTEAVTWVPHSSQPPNRVSEELELGLRARKVLLHDEVLAGQMLSVSIRNRVATLWGTVRSASAARHAEECLRSLPGLTAIRNELNVPTRAESEGSIYRPSNAQARTSRSQERSPDTRPVQGVLVRRTDGPAPKPSPEYVWRPAGTERPGVPSLPSPQRLVGQASMPEKPCAECLPGFPARDSQRRPSRSFDAPQPRSRADATMLVMPTLSLPLAPPLGSSVPEARPPTPSVRQSASSLSQAIEALRLADDRFHKVRVEVRGDAVYLGGTIYCWDHLFELARAVSRLPGVRQVQFEDVRAEFASTAR
jgi:hypothetical protein